VKTPILSRSTSLETVDNRYVLAAAVDRSAVTLSGKTPPPPPTCPSGQSICGGVCCYPNNRLTDRFGNCTCCPRGVCGDWTGTWCCP